MASRFSGDGCLEVDDDAGEQLAATAIFVQRDPFLDSH